MDIFSKVVYVFNKKVIQEDNDVESYLVPKKLDEIEIDGKQYLIYDFHLFSDSVYFFLKAV